MEKRKPNLLKDALILCLITCIAGFLLGAVHFITKEPIARQQERTQNEAYRSVCPAAASFDETRYAQALSGEEALLSQVSYVEDVTVENALAGLDADGQVVGYIVTSVCGKSYGGDIRLTVGFDLEGKITGIEVLEIQDTPGLGMKAKEAGFLNQFLGKQADCFTVTKTGEQGEDKIDAISSATITSKAFTNAVNGAKYFMEHAMAENGGEDHEGM